MNTLLNVIQTVSVFTLKLRRQGVFLTQLMTLYKTGAGIHMFTPFEGKGYDYQKLCKDIYDNKIGDHFFTHFGETIVSECSYDESGFHITVFENAPVEYTATADGLYSSVEQEDYSDVVEFSKLVEVEGHTPIVYTNKIFEEKSTYSLNPATYVAAGVGYAQLYEHDRVPALALVDIVDEIKNYNICGLGKCKGLDTLISVNDVVKLLSSVYFEAERDYKLPRQLQLCSASSDLIYRAGVLDSFIRHGVVNV